MSTRRSHNRNWTDRLRRARSAERVSDATAIEQPPGHGLSDWVVVAVTLLLGLAETTSSGLGWPWLRASAAIVIAGLLLERRRAPLRALIGVVIVSLVANIALATAGHYLLVTGLMLAVAVYALVRWAPVRHVVIGLGAVAVHAIAGYFVNPNWSAIGSLLFYGTPVLLALAMRPGLPAGSDRSVDSTDVAARSQGSVPQPTRRSRAVPVLRVGAVIAVAAAVFVATGGSYVVAQIHTYVTRTRSPSMPEDWSVEPVTLRNAAEASRGTHGPDGAIIHTANHPHQLLEALERPTFSVEVDVTVIDGEGFLQHDPREPIGLPLLDFLEYAAIADFPIVKLDLKRDRIGPVLDEVQQAIDEFGLDARQVHFNADVFRGPGVEENIFGARTDLSFTDAMYNVIVMDLEMSDLVRVAEELPESTVVISAFTPKDPLGHAYTELHLERFMAAAGEIRAVNPSQSLVFAVRGDLVARSAPSFLGGLTAIENSYVAAWYDRDFPPEPGEVEELRDNGVEVIDLGHHAAD